MADKIDIDAPQIFKKSKTNEAENWQKLKKASLNSRFTGFKTEDCASTYSLLKKFWNLMLLLTYKFTTENHQGNHKGTKDITPPGGKPHRFK